MKNLIIVVALCLAVLTSSCEKATADDPKYPYTYYRISHADIYEFRLTDGTRCVANSYRGGIDCDWDWKKR